MKLIGSRTSPYVRKARVVLAEKKIEYDFVVDSPWSPDTRVPEFNPLGKVPVLVLDDGFRLFDSRVIVEYLDNVTPNNRLLPAPNRERIAIKRWEALADGILDATVAVVFENKRPESARDKNMITRQRTKIDAGLKAIAEDLGDHNWCQGNGLTLADIATGVVLGYLDFRMPELDWRTPYPGLERLHEKMLQRATFADTVPVE